MTREPDLWYEPYRASLGLAVMSKLHTHVCPDAALEGAGWAALWIPAVEAAVREEQY